MTYWRDDQPFHRGPKFSKYTLDPDVNYDDYIELDEYDLKLLGVNPKLERIRKPLPTQDVNQFPDKKPQPHMVQCEHPRIMEHPVDAQQRVLNQSSAERKAYKASGKGEVKTVVHSEYRRLLISEIEFLTEYGEEDSLVLYAEAAPGSHINYLSSLFPSIRFVLFSDSEFDCQETDKIQIRKESLTEKIAEEYAGNDVLFIDNIVRADPTKYSFKETERIAKEDLEKKLKIYQILKPKWSLLNFRLPYEPGKTMFLDGKLYLPVWSRQRSSVCRLVVAKDAPMKTYDHTEYEEQLFHFNLVTRVSWYPYPSEIEIPGMDHCYDCASEIYVLESYLKKFKYPDGTTNDELYKAIVDMAIEINTASQLDEEASKEKTLSQI